MLRNLRICVPQAGIVVLNDELIRNTLDPNQILVKCIHSLISPGTELAMYKGIHSGIQDSKNYFAKYPFFPGYSAVGEVLAVGPDIKIFLPGQLVYYRGYHEQFSLISLNDSTIAHIPHNLSLETALFARFIGICSTALLISEGNAGDNVVVIGLGIIGNIVAQMFRMFDCSVIGIDKHSIRKEAALYSGINMIFDANQENLVDLIIKKTNGKGPRIVIEASGSPTAFPLALEIAEKGGEIILLGSTHGIVHLDIYKLIHRKGLVLKGCHESIIPTMREGMLRINKNIIELQAFNWLIEHKILVDHLISKRISPNEIAQGYEELCQKHKFIGMLLDWRLL